MWTFHPDSGMIPSCSCLLLLFWKKLLSPLLLPHSLYLLVPLLGKWKQKSLSHVQLFATPWTILSMEFSRPEYWSGWPFPSPGYLPNPGIVPRSPALQADSLPAEPPGKPKNTGVDSLCLLMQVFPAQKLNQDLLHCRWVLHQLSCQGNSFLFWEESLIQCYPWSYLRCELEIMYILNAGSLYHLHLACL